MKHTMRWFGPNDPVSLMDIRQAGCTGVVTALHQIPVGEVWSIKEITDRKNLIEKDNAEYIPLHWSVVESLPVHEDIKKGKKTRDKLIGNYQQSLQNLAATGIKTVCYNFMTVLDWSRTNLNFVLADGSETLRFVWQDFALFDLYILKRKGAEADYDEETQENARQQWLKSSPNDIKRLTETILLGLPGSGDAFSLTTFQSLLDDYKSIGDQELRENLYYFIRQITPVAQEHGIRLCIHPDDPPKPLLGLPRVVSTESDLNQILAAAPFIENGITFCTGSLGVRADNDLPGIVRRLGNRIHFAHLRSVKREDNSLNFHEAPHLEGSSDMFEIVKALLEEENKRKNAGDKHSEIPMRPDHGFKILDDFNKKTYPGYSAIGRMKGLAELRGLETALKHSIH